MARRSEEQREADLAVLSHMYLTKWRQIDMATKLGVHQSVISDDLKELHARWRASGLFNVDEKKSQELAAIDALELEAWEGYRRSVGKKTKSVVKTGLAPETQETTWHDAGDPRFLSIVMDCIQKRCDIYGLDSAKKTEISSGAIPTTREALYAAILKSRGVAGNAPSERN